MMMITDDDRETATRIIQFILGTRDPEQNCAPSTRIVVVVILITGIGYLIFQAVSVDTPSDKCPHAMQPQRRAAAEALAVAAAQRRISGDLSTLDARVNETVDEVARFGVATDQQQRQRNGAQLRRVAPAASSHAAVNMSNDSITGSPLADNVSQSPLSPAPSPPLPMQHQSQHQHPHEHSLAANFKPAARPSVRVSVSLGEQSPTNASPAARVPPPDEQTEASIIVAVRCRPMSTKELSLGCENAVSVLEGKVVVLTDPTVDANNYYRKAKEPKSFQYAFDHAFDRDCGQRHVFERTTMCLVKPIMDGFNATAFAYGSTGAILLLNIQIDFMNNPGIISHIVSTCDAKRIFQWFDRRRQDSYHARARECARHHGADA